MRAILESEGIAVTLNNVNLERPSVSSGIRVRISETDLPMALRIIENHEIFITPQPETAPSISNYILVPVDFSQYSILVIKIAAEVALNHKATLVLLNSFIDPYVGGEGVQLTDSLTYDILDADTRQQIENASKKQMKELGDEIRSAMKSGAIPAVKFSTEVLEGVPEDIIAAYSKDNPPLLTIMGTRNSDKKEKEMVGSVAAEVLDSCRYPTMSIPESVCKESHLNFSSILFFCNADQEDILAMDTFIRLFPDIKSHITIAVIPSRRRWIVRERQQSASALTDYFRNSYPDFHFDSFSVETNNDINKLSNAANLQKFDLIVVPNKKRRNILSRIFSPSLVHQIVFNNDVTMLVIPV